MAPKKKTKVKSSYMKNATKKMNVTLVGMLYRVRPDTLEEMVAQLPIKCKLEREPENEHDPNAIKVFVLEKPWAKAHGPLHLCYVNRVTASAIAPAMDLGEKSWPFTEAWLTSVDPSSGSGELLLLAGEIPSS